MFLQLTKAAYQFIPFTNPANVITTTGTTSPPGNDPFPFGQQNRFHQGGAALSAKFFRHALEIRGQ